MGALHAGHVALAQRAREECATVAASIFVNPLQFAAGEDLKKYPRDLERDSTQFNVAGVDVLFFPSPDSMYPPGFSTSVDVGEMGSVFEGAARPTHFRGVTTVVCKLLNIVQPDFLYLGQKDAQQTAVLRKMVRDLDSAVQIVVVPTEREADGLARSSRNVYLLPQEREAAPTLHHALQALRMAMSAGKSKTEAMAAAKTRLHPLAQLDYLEVVDAKTFTPIDALASDSFVIGAARFGATRLIDNLWIE